MNQEIKVRIIGRSVPIDTEIENLVSDLGDPNYIVPDSSPGDALISTAGRRCYNSFKPGLNPNVTKTRKDIGIYIDNILKSGHGSVTEHVSYTFSIEGLTRVATAELNRHRAGVAISEASMRYVRLDNGVPFWMPESLGEGDPDYKCLECFQGGHLSVNELTLDQKNEMTKALFEQIFENAYTQYKMLLELWGPELEANFDAKKKLTSMFRRIIPMGVSTGGIWTFNIRALRHVLTMRGSIHAEEEIQVIARMMYNEIIKHEPNLFKDFNKELEPEHKKV